MKRTFALLALFCFSVLSIQGQDITAVFLEIPDSVIFGLNAESKEKLVSHPNDTVKITAASSLDGIIERVAMTDDYIALKTSEVGTIQIKLLPLINDSKIVCVITSVCAKACDSRIQFYTTQWSAVSQEGLFPKKDFRWFIKPDADKGSEEYLLAEKILDMHPIKLSLSANDTTIKAEYEVINYLSAEDYQKVCPFLTEQPRTFTWDKASFK
ncbi:hypothetical protein M2132_001359 [Dysgonomonas sp. PH5-45]|uniref:DUF3256 family protein n=1 Tax=unclassified Dysgonomonas TaxID=2630389 RepID=UPI002473E82F|nr:MULTISPECIES: DUF3256 family protein [unclassified Dysgonomonas]MDH6355022.1 hypothetical protein [Dysgonomonas sp. PH5-45]MDH6387922.1 hypothetical protein [Dysgonomonas sp. PH5-37]